MFVNQSPRYEILSEESLAVLDRGWRRIVSELGVEFTAPEAVEIFAKAGMKTEGDNVFLDPDFVMEQVRKAPSTFEVHARNAANSVTIGGQNMVFGSVYGPPFVRDGDVRRTATLHDFHQFCQLSQSFPQLDSAGGTMSRCRESSGASSGSQIVPPAESSCGNDCDSWQNWWKSCRVAVRRTSPSRTKGGP